MIHPQETSPLTQEAVPYLSEQMLQLAHQICAAELVIPNREPYTEMEEWGKIALTDPSVFATPILFQSVRFERPDNTTLRIKEATYELIEKLDNDEVTTTVTVSADNKPLSDDPFVRHVYDKFWQSYNEHPHELCVPTPPSVIDIWKSPPPIVNAWDKWL